MLQNLENFLPTTKKILGYLMLLVAGVFKWIYFLDIKNKKNYFTICFRIEVIRFLYFLPLRKPISKDERRNEWQKLFFGGKQQWLGLRATKWRTTPETLFCDLGGTGWVAEGCNHCHRVLKRGQAWQDKWPEIRIHSLYFFHARYLVLKYFIAWAVIRIQ